MNSLRRHALALLAAAEAGDAAAARRALLGALSTMLDMDSRPVSVVDMGHRPARRCASPDAPPGAALPPKMEG